MWPACAGRRRLLTRLRQDWGEWTRDAKSGSVPAESKTPEFHAIAPKTPDLPEVAMGSDGSAAHVTRQEEEEQLEGGAWNDED